MRGESVDPIGGVETGIPAPSEWLPPDAEPAPDEEISSSPVSVGPSAGILTGIRVMPQVQATPETEAWQRVGKPERKVDALKLVQGKPAFTADFEQRGMLVARVLHSPLAHARIKHIDTTRAIQLPGVVAVLTYKDIPRVIYSTAGQSDPIPGPLDTFSLDEMYVSWVIGWLLWLQRLRRLPSKHWP